MNFTTFSFAQWLEEGGSSKLGTFSLNQAYNRIAWVYACVNAIAKTASSAPLLFYEGLMQTPSYLIDDPNHPVNQLFHSPSPPQIPSLRELLYRTFTHVGISGGVYWVFKRIKGSYQEVVMEINLQPILASDNETLLGWKKESSKGTQTFTIEQVLPVLLYNPGNPYLPMSPLTAARLSSESELNISGWNSSFFKNGMKNPLLIQSKGTLTREQKKEIKNEITNYYSGIDGAHGALLLQGNIEVTPLTLAPKDVDFIQGKKLNREEICAIYGVPPAVVGIFEYSNYANTKEQRKIFWENTLLPFMERISDLMQVNVLDREFPGITCKWDTSKMIGLKPDPNDVANSAKTYFDMGYTLEQISVILNVPELDPAFYGDTEGSNTTQQPEKPAEEEPAPEANTLKRNPPYLTTTDLGQWLQFYAESDKMDLDVQIASMEKALLKYVNGIDDSLQFAKPLKSTKACLDLWDDVVGKTIHKVGFNSIHSALVAMKAVSNKGQIDKNVDINAFITQDTGQLLKMKIRRFVADSRELVLEFVDAFINGNLDKWNKFKDNIHVIAKRLVLKIRETLRYYTYKHAGVVQHVWVCRDKQHEFLHGKKVNLGSEKFPIINSFHPSPIDISGNVVLECNCTTIPVIFPSLL